MLNDECFFSSPRQQLMLCGLIYFGERAGVRGIRDAQSSIEPAPPGHKITAAVPLPRPSFQPRWNFVLV
jgi:hypothetical protein